MDKKGIEHIRKAIDQLDETIVKALGERQRIVRRVLSDKLQRDVHIRDNEREEVLLEKIRKVGAEEGVDPFFLEQLFREIIQHSVRYKPMH